MPSEVEMADNAEQGINMDPKLVELINTQQDNFQTLEATKNNLKKLSVAARTKHNVGRYWKQAKDQWKAFVETHLQLKGLGVEIPDQYDEKKVEAIAIYKKIKSVIVAFDIEMMDDENDEAAQLDATAELATNVGDDQQQRNPEADAAAGDKSDGSPTDTEGAVGGIVDPPTVVIQRETPVDPKINIISNEDLTKQQANADTQQGYRPINLGQPPAAWQANEANQWTRPPPSREPFLPSANEGIRATQGQTQGNPPRPENAQPGGWFTGWSNQQRTTQEPPVQKTTAPEPQPTTASLMDFMSKFLASQTKTTEALLAQATAAKATAAETTTTPSARGPPAYNRYGLKVPELVLEVFDGDILKYYSFRKTFKNIVQRWQMADVERFLFLRSKLKGVALEELPQEVDEKAYEKAWQNLDARFDNKRMMIEECLRRMINSPTVLFHSSSSQLNFIQRFRRSIYHLECFGVTMSDVMVYHALKSMDAELLQEFERDLGEVDIMPSSSQLEAFLEKQYSITRRTEGAQD